jgi:hypothetical protein
MCHLNRRKMSSLNSWSGRRVSNSRPQPWQGCALPTELLPLRSPANHTLFGAGEESRTLDLNLGKVALYQLSYSRTECVSLPTLLLLRSGAGEESRTLDLNLGKVALYQLSYSRILETSIIAEIVTTSKTSFTAESADCCKRWSGRRVSNSRPQPWQGCALPTELLPLCLSFAAMSSQQASIIDDLIRTSRMTEK